MNTLNTIITNMNQTISSNVVEGLISLGFSEQEATKVVVEDNFSIVQDAIDNPVESF
jgi:hypothetical protein